MSASAATLTHVDEIEGAQTALSLAQDPDPARTGRDPEFIRGSLGLLDTFTSYFNPEVRGLDRLPERGPFLIVGNHNGGATPPDMPILMTEWWRTRGVDEPVYGLFHSFFFNLPMVIGVGKGFPSPPSEPYGRFSRIRLSSRWCPHRGFLAVCQAV